MKTRMLLAVAVCGLLPVAAEVRLNFLHGVEIVGGGEIVAHDAASGSVLTTVSSGAAHRVGVYALGDDGRLSGYRTLDLSTVFGPDGTSTYNLTSVATDPLGRGFGAASLIPANRLERVGKVAFFDIATGEIVAALEVGYHPDSLRFTPDGARLVVANEGEFVGVEENPEGRQTPGSVSVVNLSGLRRDELAGLTNAAVTEVDFAAGLADGVTLEGVRNARLDTLTVKRPDPLDVEPEYAVASNERAYVSLQENNAIAVIDLTGPGANRVTAIHRLGTITVTTDASDRGELALNDTVKGLPMPDGMAMFERDGVTYLVTANEGDARPDGGDMKRFSDSPINPAAGLPTGENGLSRLHIVQDMGDTNRDGLIEEPVMFGTRSFSIVNAATGERVYDSGNTIEAHVLAHDPERFNINKRPGTVQARSDDKGPEPEAVAHGRIAGRDYVFVGLERQNGIFVFDVTDFENVRIVDYVNLSGAATRNAPGADYVAPESLLFFERGEKAFLVVGFEGEGEEFDGSLAVFEVVSGSR